MDDISGKLADILNNPAMLDQIKGFVNNMGKEETTKKEPPPPKQSGMQLSPDMMNTVMKIMPLLSSMNKEDDTTRLLYALRPLLSEPRKIKLDESIKMMQMMKILPLLKKQGIF